MQRFVLIAVLLACFTPLAVAKPVKEKAPPAAEWNILSLTIQKSGTFPDHRAGTRITAKMHVPNRFIVGIDADQTTAKITDNKGHDLQAKPFKKSSFPLDDGRISDDLRYSSIVFSASNLPVQTATEVKVKGTVGVVLGSNEKSVEMPSVKFDTGEVDLGIGKLARRKPMAFGKFKEPVDFFMLTYVGAKPIKTLVVLGADGKEIEYSRNTPSENPNDKNLFRCTFHAKRTGGRFNLDGCTLRIVYFDSIDRVAIPVDLTVGLGF